MSIIKKRGISPVVATSLLVSITLILAAIIFFWARGFIGEAIEKNDRAIEYSCERVEFFVEAREGTLTVQNVGSVPIYAIEMRVKGKGEIKEIGRVQGGGTIGNGQTGAFRLPSGASVGNTIIAVPILVGETSTGRTTYVCDAKYGKETEVF